MNKHLKISLIMLVTVILLLAVTLPGLAEKSDKFFTLKGEYTVDWDNFTYTGDFSSSGAINDKGKSWGHWVLQPGGRRGVIFLESQKKDRDIFVIMFKAPYFELDDENCVDGTFYIDASLGTGDYEGMWGTGTLRSCRPYMDEKLYMTLEGRVP